MKSNQTNTAAELQAIRGMSVKTGLRAAEADNIFESFFFGLLDALRGPTEQAHRLLVSSPRPSLGGGAMRVRTNLRSGKLVGDLAQAFTRATGLDDLAAKYTEKTGRDCGCDKRHEILDALFPF